LPTTAKAIKLSPKDASAFTHRCEAYESKEDPRRRHCRLHRGDQDRSKYGWAYNNRGVAYYGLHEYDAALADHAEAIRVDSRDVWAYCPPRHGVTEKGEFDQAVADITEGDHNRSEYAFGFGKGVRRSSGRG